MKGLLKYLSPFAPDQSGATAVLYDLGGVMVICDAGGCTGHIGGSARYGCHFRPR